MSNMPPVYAPPPYPPQQLYGLPQPRQTSTAAIVSLVSGLFGCFVVTAIVAVIAGIIGIRQTANPNVKGRGLAVAGLILGLIFGLIGTGVIGAGYYAYHYGMKVAALTPAVVNAVIDGDLQKAGQNTSLSHEELADIGKQVAGWGKMTGVSGVRWTGRENPKKPDSIILTGTAAFEKAGNKEFEMTLDVSTGEMRFGGIIFK